MSKILIATMGLSPGVVTSAYFMLERQGYGRMDQVISVTTSSAAARPCEQLVWQTLQAADPHPQYQPLRAVGEQELRNSQAANRFTLFMEKLLGEHGHNKEIYLVLSGGRTSMAAGAMLAVQKYTFNQPDLAKTLRMFHVEVIDPDLDERGAISRLATMTPTEQKYYLDPPPDAISLVQVPVLTLSQKPKQLWARLFEYATGDYLLETQTFEQVRYSYYPEYLRDQKGLGEVDVYAEKRLGGAIEAVERVDRPTLRGLMMQSYNEGELRTLCFDLGIEYDDLGGKGREGNIRELISYAERNGRIVDLIEASRRRYPRYPWLDAVNLRQVILCECKLRTGDDPGAKPIEAEVVRRLADKAAAVHAQTGRPVTGWVVTNTPYAEPMALELAQAKGIHLYCAALPGNWKERADWRIRGELKPLASAPGWGKDDS